MAVHTTVLTDGTVTSPAEPDAPQQSIVVKKGSGEFELSCEIREGGAQHITLYDQQDHRPIGGIYFGTAKKMAEFGDLMFSDYKLLGVNELGPLPADPGEGGGREKWVENYARFWRWADFPLRVASG